MQQPHARLSSASRICGRRFGRLEGRKASWAFSGYGRAVTGLPLDTASGVRLDLDDPRPDDITLSDVAAALSKTCRFGAQARSFYSVAQHAVLVADLVEDAGHPELALAALHHDSHEAYACDLATPLKHRIDAASGGY